MIYKVLAVHKWAMKLGVIGYLTDGEVFQQAVEKLVVSFPKMYIDLPERELDSDTIYTAFHHTAARYLSDYKAPLSRAELTLIKGFLDSLNDEYRRWRFDAGMGCQRDDSVMEELQLLVNLHKAVRSDNFSVIKTLIDYTIEELAQFFSTAIVEEFQDAVTLFTHHHQRPISNLAVSVDFPKSQYNIMDMRLLIHIPEE